MAKTKAKFDSRKFQRDVNNELRRIAGRCPPGGSKLQSYILGGFQLLGCISEDALKVILT
jgi:hypothetical protein